MVTQYYFPEKDILDKYFRVKKGRKMSIRELDVYLTDLGLRKYVSINDWAENTVVIETDYLHFNVYNYERGHRVMEKYYLKEDDACDEVLRRLTYYIR